MAEIIKTDLHPINEPDKILYPTTSPDQIVGLDEYIDNKTLTGPIGPVGPQGGDGEKGDKGDKGDPGESPVINANATVDNSAIGIPACDVKKTQTAPNTFNYQFNFRNIKGAKGDEGKQGAAGKDGVEITSIHTLRHRVGRDETINTVEAVYSDGNSSEFEVHCENGADFKVTAYVQSTEQLPLANEEYAGIAYGVGATEPYNVYICVLNTASEPYHYEWVNFGTIQGPKGDKGDTGADGMLPIVEAEIEYDEGVQRYWVSISEDNMNILISNNYLCIIKCTGVGASINQVSYFYNNTNISNTENTHNFYCYLHDITILMFSVDNYESGIFEVECVKYILASVDDIPVVPNVPKLSYFTLLNSSISTNDWGDEIIAMQNSYLHCVTFRQNNNQKKFKFVICLVNTDARSYFTRGIAQFIQDFEGAKNYRIAATTYITSIYGVVKLFDGVSFTEPKKVYDIDGATDRLYVYYDTMTVS